MGHALRFRLDPKRSRPVQSDSDFSNPEGFPHRSIRSICNNEPHSTISAPLSTDTLIRASMQYGENEVIGIKEEQLIASRRVDSKVSRIRHSDVTNEIND